MNSLEYSIERINCSFAKKIFSLGNQYIIFEIVTKKITMNKNNSKSSKKAKQLKQSTLNFGKSAEKVHGKLIR